MNAEKQRLHDATDNLVTQQFYKNGHDTIIGRTPNVKLKISKSGQIVKKFKDLFNENLKHFLDGNYKNFLSPFKKIKGINEEVIQQIQKDLEQKLNLFNDSDSDLGNVVLYTLVLSALISRIRDIHFNKSIEEIKKRIKKKLSFTNQTDDDIQRH
ncbi:MAG: hypothetical protein ACFFAO_05900 [Candidatus Hermodarchaeota archaeon]